MGTWTLVAGTGQDPGLGFFPLIQSARGGPLETSSKGASIRAKQAVMSGSYF
ncbi:MAG: hypothetical protein ACJAVK_000399 [Akkermansiaceae bacterium]|jgi:hypothetical protein